MFFLLILCCFCLPKFSHSISSKQTFSKCQLKYKKTRSCSESVDMYLQNSLVLMSTERFFFVFVSTCHHYAQLQHYQCGTVKGTLHSAVAVLNIPVPTAQHFVSQAFRRELSSKEPSINAALENVKSFLIETLNEEAKQRLGQRGKAFFL